MQTETRGFREHHVAIIGVGLIGGSIAAALRKRFPECRVTGIGRSRERLQRAQDVGLLDGFSTTIDRESCPPGSLSIVCLPVGHIAEAVREISACSSDNSLITDAGSVKSQIYSELQGDSIALRRYVGSHPIAGSEHVGFEHAQENLFVRRMCVVTPESAERSDVERVCALWRGIGSHVQIMTAAEHDRVLALTSHLPHILASVGAGCVTTELLPFTGTGFRDTTRVAAGSADLWAQILCGNRQFVTQAIQTAEHLLQRIRSAVECGDQQVLEQTLQTAAEVRRQLKHPSNADGSESTGSD